MQAIDIEPEPKTLDAEFLAKVTKIIEDNLNNNDFSTATLAQKVFLSRSQLHRKLKALTGKSTTIFIRSIRLEKAKKLLKTTDKSISQIALEVGFSSLPWFTQCFGAYFGETPSDFRANEK